MQNLTKYVTEKIREVEELLNKGEERYPDALCEWQMVWEAVADTSGLKKTSEDYLSAKKLINDKTEEWGTEYNFFKGVGKL